MGRERKRVNGESRRQTRARLLQTTRDSEVAHKRPRGSGILCTVGHGHYCSSNSNLQFYLKNVTEHPYLSFNVS